MEISRTSKMNRRAMLKASGICMALPWMESFAGKAPPKPPKRFCSIYFPYGVSLPNQDSEFSQWNWFPKGEGKDFTFNKSLEPLDKFRDQVTVLGGLCHPKVKRIGGHDSGDTFLTGEEMSLKANGLKNSISLDQLWHTPIVLDRKLDFPACLYHPMAVLACQHVPIRFPSQTPVNPFLPLTAQPLFSRDSLV